MIEQARRLLLVAQDHVRSFLELLEHLKPEPRASKDTRRFDKATKAIIYPNEASYAQLMMAQLLDLI